MDRGTTWITARSLNEKTGLVYDVDGLPDIWSGGGICKDGSGTGEYHCLS